MDRSYKHVVSIGQYSGEHVPSAFSLLLSCAMLGAGESQSTLVLETAVSKHRRHAQLETHSGSEGKSASLSTQHAFGFGFGFKRVGVDDRKV